MDIQRLNRTFYSLTKIEKLATEYASSDFMLVAKLISDEIDINDKEINDDYNISKDFRKWAKSINYNQIKELVINQNIFTTYEISRKVHLMSVLNILGTIEFGFINRNIKDSILEEYKDNFNNKSEVILNLNSASEFYLSLKLKKASYWYNKANFFSLIIFFYNNLDEINRIGKAIIKERLNQFEENLTDEYSLAAKEGVNNKKERLIRNKILTEILLN